MFINRGSDMPRPVMRGEPYRSTVMQEIVDLPDELLTHLRLAHPDYMWVGRSNYFRFFLIRPNFNVCRLCKKQVIEGGGTSG